MPRVLCHSMTKISGSRWTPCNRFWTLPKRKLSWEVASSLLISWKASSFTWAYYILHSFEQHGRLGLGRIMLISCELFFRLNLSIWAGTPSSSGIKRSRVRLPVMPRLWAPMPWLNLKKYHQNQKLKKYEAAHFFILPTPNESMTNTC